MKYEYEDMKRLRFTNKLMDEFIGAVNHKTGSKFRIKNKEFLVEDISDQLYEETMCLLLEKLYAADYRNRPEYLLANDSRERALAAMKGSTDKVRDNVLAFWASFADTLTDFEKVMLGWDKV